MDLRCDHAGAMKTSSLALALALGAALVVGPVASAQAAAPVTIQKLPTTTVPFDSTKTITPKFVAQKNVKIDKAVLKVARDGRILANDVPRISLGKGTYNVRQTVVYRVVTQAAKSEETTIPNNTTVAATCTITAIERTSDAGGVFDSTCDPKDTSTTDYTETFDRNGTWADDLETGGTFLRFADEGAEGPSVDAPAGAFKEQAAFDVQRISTTKELAATVTTPEKTSAATTTALSQKLTVKSRPEPKGCASKAEVRSLKLGYDEKTDKGTGDTVATVAKKLDSKGKRDFKDGSLEQRSYKACSGDPVSVGFASGRAAYAFSGPQSG